MAVTKIIPAIETKGVSAGHGHHGVGLFVTNWTFFVYLIFLPRILFASTASAKDTDQVENFVRILSLARGEASERVG